jgi:hypothetical protein
MNIWCGSPRCSASSRAWVYARAASAAWNPLAVNNDRPRADCSDLPTVPSRTFGQSRQCCKTALEMIDRFKMGRARRGMLAGLQPFIDRTLDIAGASQVMRQEFGLALDKIHLPRITFLPSRFASVTCMILLKYRVPVYVSFFRIDLIRSLSQRCPPASPRLLAFRAAPPVYCLHEELCRRTRGEANVPFSARLSTRFARRSRRDP